MQINIGIDDFYNPLTYIGLGYDQDFARQKVQENLIVYALARALKPTGRLNVDYVNNARRVINLQGLTSPDFVRTQLVEILRFLRKGQVDLFEAGKYGENKNIFDDQKYNEQGLQFQQFLGEVPVTPPPPPAEGDVDKIENTDDALGISLEPEDLLGGQT